MKALEAKIERLTEKPPDLPDDPIEFCEKILRFHTTTYQERFLRTQSKRVILLWARQTGKTRALAAKAILQAARNPGTTTLVVAPGLRQSMTVGRSIKSHLDSIPWTLRRKLVSQQLRTIFRFRNGSEIVILPNSENQLRGFSAHLIIVDEAAFFRNDETIFHNILPPLLATTGGTLVVSSTPWGKNTVFYALNQDPDYEKHTVTWTQAQEEGVYHPTFIDHIHKTRKNRPEVYRMEFEAQFAEEADTWLTQDLIAKCCNEDLDYLHFDHRQRGRFYMGIDLAERVDHSAIAVLRCTETRLELSHMHQFKLKTSLAAVIGYAKILSQRWTRIEATYIDKTKHGDYIVEHFREAGTSNPAGITFTTDTKQEMAQILKQRMTRGTLHLPYDRETIDELNTEQYELTKTGKIAFTHPPDAHDDRFWALALAAYAAEKAPPSPSIPIARTI